jgi:type I restriction enzyme S subunit
MKSIPLVIPTAQILSTFETYIQPFFNKMRNNSEEEITLIKLRDTLLPKLMSGEIEL